MSLCNWENPGFLRLVTWWPSVQCVQCLLDCNITDSREVAVLHHFSLSYFTASTRSVAIRPTHKPGLHAVRGKYYSVTDCNLFSNAEYEKSQIKLRVWGLMVIHLVEKTSLWNKTAPPELSLCHCFFVFVSAGGGGRVYRWVPGWGWGEDSAETLKNNTKHSQFLYLSGLQSVVDRVCFTFLLRAH